MTPTSKILQGHCLDKLAELQDNSVHCVVTSPPYWGLRDYKIPPVHWPEVTFSPMAGLPPMTIPAQDAVHGLEPDLWAYVAHEVAVFREVRRVLRDDGTLWLNLGDAYWTSGNRGSGGVNEWSLKKRSEGQWHNQTVENGAGLKPKDLIGIPWRVALALQADGWFLRSDIIWAKPNPMPESVTDRPTKSHEYLFLLSKKQKYFYDAEAVREPHMMASVARMKTPLNAKRDRFDGTNPKAGNFNEYLERECGWGNPGGRNKRTVWTIPSFAFKDAHFATYPPALVRPCILAGTSARGACVKCGAPWERVVEKVSGYDGARRNDDLEKAGTSRGTSWKSGPEIAKLPGSKTLSWRPTCECNGKLVMETVTIPPTDTSTWNGSRFDDGKNAQTKPNQGKLAEKERTRKRTVYHSDLPLDRHPVQPCTVLDPFSGSGTTAQVSLEEGRSAIGIEINREYLKLSDQRTLVTPSLAIA